MKRNLALVTATVLLAAGLTACTPKSDTPESGKSFDTSSGITVVSREDGSGTRGAFVELLGVESKNADGSKTDLTTSDAIIANKTGVVMTNVANDRYAIGYISLGSLNDTVKALKIDGADATAENIKNGTYPIARPFNIATKGTPSGVAADFIKFILSKKGQAVVAGGYIPVNDNAEAFTSDMSQGKIVVAGSSSVTPVMEMLVEAYLAVNSNANIEIQMSDSTSGMTGAKDGTCDIGMASRDLKGSELQALTPTVIAMDGIAVIVNNANPITDISSEQVRQIYMGEILSWDEIG
jgi:phosphate transport system substrate-binding protein